MEDAAYLDQLCADLVALRHDLHEHPEIGFEVTRTSDLVATVPARHTGNLRQGMHSFPLPFASPAIAVAMIWHPRLDADPVHRWLRGCLRDACAESPDA